MLKVLPRYLTRWFVIFPLFLFASCGTKTPYYGNYNKNWKEAPQPAEVLKTHSVYLLGDLKTEKPDHTSEVLNGLKATMKESGNVSNSVVLLGNNMETKPSKEFIAQLKDFKEETAANIYVIPGEMEWNSGKESGQQSVRNIANAMNEAFSDTIFYPKEACPGPTEIKLNENLVLLLIDTQWWLHPNSKPMGAKSPCSAEDKFSFILRLEELVEKHEDKHIIVAQHHPLFSNGHHGGFFSVKDHVFPFTFLHKALYIPLPLVGSVYPIVRYLGVAKQDIAHPDYARMQEEMLAVIEEKGNVTLVAAHDNSLQYTRHKEIHHVVSGAASKTDYAQIKNKAEFVYQHRGFARLNYYQTGECWVDFFVPANNEPSKVFSAGLYAIPPERSDDPSEDLKDYTDSTNVLAAGPEYKAGKFKKWILGDHYRKEWATPVTVPLLDFQRENGGLEIIKKGGGNQTISLEVQAKNEIFYDLRSVNKDPKGAVPSPLLNTFAQEVVQDQISSAHPYGALALPKMSEALDLYYTMPKLFQVPYTPLLGKYYDDFAGMMVYKETELDEDLSDYKRFGYSENVVSENTLYEHLQEDNDNEFDEQMFVKARLFDMFIGDWDRHDGQWGFAEFEKEDKGSIFRPIPKDRDQVFAKFDGVLPYLASRKWAVRKFTHFDEDFNDVIGLNYNGRYIDRRLLSSLEWHHWENAVDSIELLLTDSIIDASIKDLPPEVYPISGSEIASKLKKRRPKLKQAAREYYEVLAKEVDIVASDKHEFFHIERRENGDTRVRSFKTQKEGDLNQKLFDRTFKNNETDEIRIYSRKGNDSILIEGEGKSKILIRIIGGSEEEVVIDKTSGKNLIIYDDKSEENNLVVGPKARLKLSDKDYIYEYDLEAFKYDYLGPRITGEINPDDGLYIGGGAKILTYGFRKDPAATEHSILASYAFATGAYNITYNGTWYSLFAKNWDLEIDASTFGPRFVFNYFGQGNATDFENDDIDFYRVKLDNVNFRPSINHRVNRFFTFGAGPRFSYYYVRNNPETILNTAEFDQPEEIEQAAYFTGGELFANLELTNHPVHPSKGINWYNTISYSKQLNNQKDEFVLLSTDVSLYYTPKLPVRLTAAVRFGVSSNLGDYKFYQSNFLGGSTNLRGFRRTRFAGETVMFNNTELRLEISEIHNYVFTGKWGLTAFVDSGRVWSDLDQSDKWHRGYGPGIWLNAFELLLVSAHYGISDDGDFFNIQIGHFF